MVIQHIKLSNFRNHINTELQLSKSPILIWGNNGAGKTSVLESIHLMALSKSFLNVSDTELITHGYQCYTITGLVAHDNGTSIEVSVEYSASEGKQITISHVGRSTAQELIGLLPCVVLSNSVKELITGEPIHRRTFIDRILSQCSSVYKDTLWRYRNALRQRNRLLYTGDYTINELSTWTNEMLELSAELVWRRMLFIRYFNMILERHCTDLDLAFQLRLQYHCPWLDKSFQPPDWGEDKTLFTKQLYQRVQSLVPLDISRMATQWGPQRDIFTFCSGDHLLYVVASQGQQKLALYAIKIAEAEVLQESTNRLPIVLLDDLFSDVDNTNAGLIERNVLSLASRWQMIITAPTTNIVKFPDRFHMTQLRCGKIVDH